MTATDLDHIARTELPWRTATPRTECGLTDTSALSADEFEAKALRQGQRRTALTTCMTCLDRVRVRGRSGRRIGPFEVLAREVDRVRRSRGTHERDALELELTAISALIGAHRDEFDALVTGLGQTTSLDERRQRRQQGR